MLSPKIVLWCGMAGICAGLSWIITGISPNWPVPLVIALILGLGGLVGLYSRQGGKLGLTGFTLGIIGTGLVLLVLGRAFTSSDLAAVESDPSLAAPTILGLSLGQLALGIGVILLGISGLHAEKSRASKGLPLGVGLLGVISGVIFWQVLYVPLSQGRFPWEPWNVGMYVLYPVVHVLLGIGWLILGSTLATEADAQIAPVSPVSA